MKLTKIVFWSGLFVFVFSLSSCSNSNNASTPYKGQEERKIKALSQQEVNDYLKGDGLGYAKTAELNSYPGPRHILDLSKELKLTTDQIYRTEDIFKKMNLQAIDLGKQFIEKEIELEQAFASGSIDGEKLNLALSTIAEIESKIRYTHLKAHLDQKGMLTQQQITLYDKLRGYGEGNHDGNHDRH